MGVWAEAERLSLNTIIADSVECWRRELVFSSDIAILVTGRFNDRFDRMPGSTTTAQHDHFPGAL